MPDLFISYARSDSPDFVARLSAALEECGKDTWVDLDDIPGLELERRPADRHRAERLLRLRDQPGWVR